MLSNLPFIICFLKPKVNHVGNFNMVIVSKKMTLLWALPIEFGGIIILPILVG
jgi:hypothetical protein